MRQIILSKKVVLYWDRERAVVEIRRVRRNKPSFAPSLRIAESLSRDEALLMASELIRFVMDADISERDQ